MNIQKNNARPAFKGHIGNDVLTILKNIEEKMPNGNPQEAINVLDTFLKKLPDDIGLHLMATDVDPDKIKNSRNVYNIYNSDIHGPMADVLYKENKKAYEESVKHDGELYIEIGHTKKMFLDGKVADRKGIVDYDKFLDVFKTLTFEKLKDMIPGLKEKK